MILLDSGPLVDLIRNHRDAQHPLREKAVALAGRKMVVCEPVLTEVLYLTRTPNQRAAGFEFLRLFDVQVIPVLSEPDDVVRVETWLARYAEHDPDVADACLACLSSKHRKAQVWTLDSEFRQIWRRLDGSAIPLA